MSGPNVKTNRFGRWALPLLLVAAVLSLFWPALLHPFSVVHPTFSPFSDVMVIHWPKARLMAQSWQAQAELPHWTPLILSGMPLAANQLAMLSYPPAWLFLIFPVEPTFNLLFIFHLLLGGFGVYFLLRENHRCSPAAALLGGLAFALNGKWLAHVAGGHVSMVGAIGWMVWGVVGLLKLLDANDRENDAVLQRQSATLPPLRPRFPAPLLWSSLVAVALAMQLVTHTLITLYSVYLLGAMVGWHFILRFKQRRWPGVATEIKRLAGPLLLIPVLAGLLGAGQLLPLLELVQFSNRSLSLAQAAEYAVTPAQLLIGLLLPSAQGGHEFVIYLGLIPLLLLPFGLTRRRRWSWFYGGVLIFTLLFALGPATPVHALFYRFAPGFSWVRTPARIFFVGGLAASVLAGFAIDRLAMVEWSNLWQKRLTLAAVGGGALALLLGVGLAIGFGQTSRATAALALVAPAGLAVAALRVRRLISARWSALLLGALLFLDLASFDASLLRFASLDSALAPGRPAAEYLARKLESPDAPLFRSYSPSYSLPVQTAAAHNLQLADGVEPVHLAVYDRYMARAGGYGDPAFSVTIPNFGNEPLETALQDVEPDLRLLGLLDAQYLVSAFEMDWPGLTLETKIGGSYIYANRRALPRARVVHQTAQTEPDWLSQLENLPDVANVATVEDGPQLPESTRPASPARLTHYSADRLEIETDIEAPGWLALSEIWYPGWQATVNGQPQPVAKVNGMFRGVYLSQPGRYEVTLTYQPASVVWGNRLAGVGVALLAGTALWGVRGRIFRKSLHW